MPPVIKKPLPRNRPKAPVGMGTMYHLAQRTGLSIRLLYRMRAAGVFAAARKYSKRQVYYELDKCVRAIEADAAKRARARY